MEQYIVTGMSCAACSSRVEKAVSKVPGVTSCSVSLLTNSMGVEGTASEQEIIKAVADAGYGASKKGEGAAKTQSSSASAGEDMLKDRTTPALKKRLIASLGFLIVLMYFSMGHMMWGWPVPGFMKDNHVMMGLLQMLLTIAVMVINQKFFNAETSVYAEGTQTAQALALYLGLVPEGKEQLVADKLREVVAGNNYFLDFGLLGSKTVPAMLTKYGYIEDAMKMITKTEAPSWGYWVETMGYSTLPETWTLSPKFADASLNHVFMGDVSAWMMNQLAGINHDDSDPGFRHIRITPHFVKELDWAKGEYHSVRGRIASEWKREGDKVMLTVTIPADCSADIVVGDQTETVSAGTHTFTYPA